MNNSKLDISTLITVDIIGKGHFTLGEEIGSGAQGRVFKAMREITEDEIAVKLLILRASEFSSGNPPAYNKWLDDYKICKAFKNHQADVVEYQNLVIQRVVLDGIESVCLAICMELAPLGDLERYLKSGSSGLVGQKDILSFLLTLASALKDGHAKGFLHKDIKAQNILLFGSPRSPKPKLADFGLATESSETELVFGGTEYYLAPEQFSRHAPTEAGDIYSLGVLFYYIATKKLPYTLASPAKTKHEQWLAYAGMHAGGAANFDLVPDSELGKLIATMMNRDPSLRPKINVVFDTLTRKYEQAVAVTRLHPENEAIVRPASYRWNKHVHALLGSDLHYFFIKGADSLFTPKWFYDEMSAKGLHGYSFYRILGGFDYIMRVWIKAGWSQVMDKIVKAFRDRGSIEHFQARAIDRFCSEKPLKIQSEPELLDAIIECRDATNAESEFSALAKLGLVTSRFVLQERNPIRCFLTIKIRASNDKRAIEVGFGETLRRNLQKTKAKSISIYEGHGMFDILVKFRLKNFELFAPIFECVISTAEELQIRSDSLDTQTYIEMDTKNVRTMMDGEVKREFPVDSDDGSIIPKVNARAASNSSVAAQTSFL